MLWSPSIGHLWRAGVAVHLGLEVRLLLQLSVGG